MTSATTAGEIPGPRAAGVRPASSALVRVFAIFPALIRLTCGLAGAVVALAVRGAPVQTSLLVPVVGVLTAWSVLFAVWTLGSGLGTPVVLVDLTLTAATCLLMDRLVAAEVLPGEVSWVAILASTSVILAQFGLRAPASIPAGLLVAAAYALGAHRSGDDTEAVAHATTLVVQTLCTAGLVFLTRRSSRTADAVFDGYQRSSRDALIARAAREAERRQNRDLHDTVLSTLTVVGLGAVGTGSSALRERAAADLRTLTEQASARTREDGPRADPAGAVGLDERLRDLTGRYPRLRLTNDVAAVAAVPPAVAEAIVDSAAEALANVARHAPDAAVGLRLTERGGTVLVEVADDGPGFDPGAVPLHRFGLRESVLGRMATAGGRAEVDSAPGRGTLIRLTWSR
ncbi:ATP-binding protein [Micromonospora sp. NPDC049559]|uniref:sensor histidine kinase n=1 Tax=Micromonospora sp. NPDC049559 TaxID=3155923 RepID=UPI003431B803